MGREERGGELLRNGTRKPDEVVGIAAEEKKEKTRVPHKHILRERMGRRDCHRLQDEVGGGRTNGKKGPQWVRGERA